MKMTRIGLLPAFALLSAAASAQEKPVVRMLDSVLIRNVIQSHLPEVQGRISFREENE